ncbi:glutamate decarboxylase [Cutaneotrichosporon oleaginosum]|uniref:Glutamate decarboxylase n=1 Tax=Cutaneotrichosporon oleaginosum TaxID=879819 RepID=A0A0J0XUG9_9TREE|nr:glutamate decarboxylase [Cutaneotrichosporon oleaginosum]KLT44756.1 glutamate decarboxylase [Cutaneotrichosporon oleaginosum]TXT07742.1 hypothetical protein COLE_04666 [Cutaneotrichosporon oleaginosum]
MSETRGFTKVDVDQIINDSRDNTNLDRLSDCWGKYDIPYASRYDIDMTMPQHNLPEIGIEAKVAYQLLHDELELDGNPNMNLASFVHTWVPDECRKLMNENLSKNLADQDEYPAATEIHNRCIAMIAGLWNAPPGDVKGTACTGSSEAIMLGGLAMKRRWQAKMKAAGKDIYRPGPNIVMGAEAQVALEKFASYFEVETRLVPVTRESDFVMDPKEAMKHVDENTIGVFVILGSTYTGAFENVKEMSDLLDAYEEKTGNHVPIHVDAASGGFVAPFAYPKLEWDFRLPRVCSINASGHKYGASLVGVGWIVWRSPNYLPKDMVFELHYLGETDFSFNLNFSRPTHPILGQMFNFINLGMEGYQRVIAADLVKARVLSRALERSGYFVCLSNIHKPVKPETLLGKAAQNLKIEDDQPEYYVPGLPVVSFRFTDEIKKKYPNLKQAWVQSQLRGIGWIVPNYALPPAEDKTEILRVVVRESLSGDLLHKLIHDIVAVTEMLLADAGPSPSMSTMDCIDKAIRARPGRARHAMKEQTGQGDKGKKAAYIC